MARKNSQPTSPKTDAGRKTAPAPHYDNRKPPKIPARAHSHVGVGGNTPTGDAVPRDPRKNSRGN
jgi:hypothetical protein